jgi:surface antigen
MIQRSFGSVVWDAAQKANEQNFNSDYEVALFNKLRKYSHTVGVSNGDSFCTITRESLKAALKAVRHCS